MGVAFEGSKATNLVYWSFDNLLNFLSSFILR